MMVGLSLRDPPKIHKRMNPPKNERRKKVDRLVAYKNKKANLRTCSLSSWETRHRATKPTRCVRVRVYATAAEIRGWNDGSHYDDKNRTSACSIDAYKKCTTTPLRMAG